LPFSNRKNGRKQQSIGSHASTHQASIAFQINNWTLPPENTFGLWVNSDSPVGFADIRLTYNPSLVKMTKEISLKGNLARVIKITSMSEANNTGSVSIILGLDPNQIGSPPSGSFQNS